MILTHTVLTPSGATRVFAATPWFSRTEQELHLEPSFYTNGLPLGGHWELEIQDPHVWEHKRAEKIHYHVSARSGGNYVCWLGQLPTINDAELFFRSWAVGTAYTMDTGDDYAHLWVDNGQDADKFLVHMASQFNYHIK